MSPNLATITQGPALAPGPTGLVRRQWISTFTQCDGSVTVLDFQKDPPPETDCAAFSATAGAGGSPNSAQTGVAPGSIEAPASTIEPTTSSTSTTPRATPSTTSTSSTSTSSTPTTTSTTSTTSSSTSSKTTSSTTSSSSTTTSSSTSSTSTTSSSSTTSTTSTTSSSSSSTSANPLSLSSAATESALSAQAAKESSGMSPGVVALIVAALILLVAAGFGFWYWRKLQKQKKLGPTGKGGDDYFFNGRGTHMKNSPSRGPMLAATPPRRRSYAESYRGSYRDSMDANSRYANPYEDARDYDRAYDAGRGPEYRYSVASEGTYREPPASRYQPPVGDIGGAYIPNHNMNNTYQDPSPAPFNNYRPGPPPPASGPPPQRQAPARWPSHDESLESLDTDDDQSRYSPQSRYPRYSIGAQSSVLFEKPGKGRPVQSMQSFGLPQDIR